MDLLINEFSKIVVIKCKPKDLAKATILPPFNTSIINSQCFVLKFNKYPNFSEVNPIGSSTKGGFVIPNKFLYHKK